MADNVGKGANQFAMRQSITDPVRKTTATLGSSRRSEWADPSQGVPRKRPRRDKPDQVASRVEVIERPGALS